MLLAVLILAGSSLTLCQTFRTQIPSVDIYEPRSTDRPFIVTSDIRIAVDASSAHVGSPSLLDYATTFRDDFNEILTLKSAPTLRVHFINETSYPHSTIILSTGASNLSYFNGQLAREGYEIDISEQNIMIRGVDAIGTWWGTRTLLQQIVASRNLEDNLKNEVALEAGKIRDSPGWPVRGFMLDAGRHWFEPQFIGPQITISSSENTNQTNRTF
jgi:hexosaminidase